MAAEAAGLTLSAIALASLFRTCIDCLDAVSAFQQYSSDLTKQIKKLEIEKMRLFLWAEAVGLCRESGYGRAPELDDSRYQMIIVTCLNRIVKAYQDGQILTSKYGLMELDPPEAMSTFPAAISRNSRTAFDINYNRFAIGLEERQRRTGVWSKIKWIIRDKTRFENLISDLVYFVDRLVGSIPQQREYQHKMFIQDLQLVQDLDELKLVEEACHGFHDDWASVASEVYAASVAASDLGMHDRGTVEPAGADLTEESFLHSYIQNWRSTVELPSTATKVVANARRSAASVFDGEPGEAVEVEIVQLQKQDPLGMQIWKLYNNQLPNKERMANLTWRMMHMNVQRQRKQIDRI